MSHSLVPLRNLYPFALTLPPSTVFTWTSHWSLSLNTRIHSRRPANISLLPETYKLTRLFCMSRSSWYIDISHMEHTNNNKRRSPPQQKQSIFKATVFWIPFISLHVCLSVCLQNCSYVLKFLLFMYTCLPHCHRRPFRFSGHWSSEHRHTAENRSVYCRHWPYNLHG